MNNRKVSIVLPVYNGEKHVANSIESIMAQTYQNWELIVVNDCSTDSTLEICNGLANKDGRIKVISNPVNLKLPNTLNAGFDAASGDYYTWTSDDNMYRPNAIEVLVNTLQSDSDLVMVYSDYTSIDGDGNIIAEGKLPDSQYIVMGNVCGACFLYTAEVAKKVGRYDANLFLAEDYDYWMRIYRYGKVKHITDNLYLYRRHACSLSETKKASIQEQTYKAIEKNFLPLYVDAKKHNLEYAFFDNVIRRGQAHEAETKDMLYAINKGYMLYLRKCAIKKTIKGIINGTVYNTHKS
ncbi:glycosyltransferase family A protein [Butyrivibrio sp. INlla16]|uniref:glycosyltransferase family 2 protein n=1 Tax=Butyrivibrio sp. INlla16 TaxID=1520807 RepID=UPI000881078A|nr:glycosyltransferase family A protein [Butyrivibrio sp. INlla16]SDB68209.1 Glycosyltransferase involved in cell wall bisynthesis [Butyrivibrio sp. INlla16]